MITSRKLCGTRPNPANAELSYPILGERSGSTESPQGPDSTTQPKVATASPKPVGYRRGGRTATGGCQSPQDMTANKVPSQTHHSVSWEPDPTWPGRLLHSSMSWVGRRCKYHPVHHGCDHYVGQGCSCSPTHTPHPTPLLACINHPAQPSGTQQERRAQHQCHPTHLQAWLPTSSSRPYKKP